MCPFRQLKLPQQELSAFLFGYHVAARAFFTEVLLPKDVAHAEGPAPQTWCETPRIGEATPPNLSNCKKECHKAPSFSGYPARTRTSNSRTKTCCVTTYTTGYPTSKNPNYTFNFGRCQSRTLRSEAYLVKLRRFDYSGKAIRTGRIG